MRYEIGIKNILFKYKTALALSLAVFVLDRILKYLALASRIFIYKNTGTAFSLPIPKSLFLIFYIFIFLLLFFLIFLAIKNLIKNNFYYFFGFFWIFLGAFSNLLDRLKFGWIIDYFNFGFFYNNLADILICFGVIIVGWKMIFKEK